MNIYVSGVHYKKTPIEIRERLSFNTAEQRILLEGLARLSSINECVVLSTCNRTEIYICSETGGFDTGIVEKYLCEMKGLSLYELKKYFYTYSGKNAVKHLFKVACGLDSLVLGEDQILGQVKCAHELAMEAKASGSVLNTLFREAVTAAKKVKTCTGLSTTPVSIGTLAVKLVSDIFNGEVSDKSALIIGTGKMGTIALKNLVSRGIGRIFVTNRTHGKADDLSRIYKNVDTVGYNDRYSVIDECDIVISSTSSPHYTITGDMLEKAVTTCKERVFVDLAVPRDIDDSIKALCGISYYNIDHLQSISHENSERKLGEASKAERMITGYVDEFEKWYEFRVALPVIKEIQRFADGVADEKAMSALSRLKLDDEDEKEIVKASVHGAVNTILNKLIYSMKASGKQEELTVFFKCLGNALKAEKDTGDENVKNIRSGNGTGQH